jgi:hypothetical protein
MITRRSGRWWIIRRECCGRNLDLPSASQIDERLEQLTERHEALTLTVELLGRRLDDVVTAINKDAENIRALARVAEIQNKRLTRLEDGS